MFVLILVFELETKMQNKLTSFHHYNHFLNFEFFHQKLTFSSLIQELTAVQIHTRPFLKLSKLVLCVFVQWILFDSWTKIEKNPKLLNNEVKTSVFGRQATLVRQYRTYGALFVKPLFKTSVILPCKKHSISNVSKGR